MTKLDIIYSRFIFRFDDTKRMDFARKLASMLRNDFNLMDALDRTWMVESKNGKKPNEPFAIVARDIKLKLERGVSFPDAINYWAPANEALILTVGDMSKLSIALDNMVRIGEGVSKIRSSVRDAMLYPLFLLALTFLIIIAVGLYLVPPLEDAAGGNVIWHGTAATLVQVSYLANIYWQMVLASIGIIGFIIWKSLSLWSGRLRYIFDSIPPWSIYKISISTSWMMTLAAMVASGAPLPVAIRILSENSTPYLRNILEKTNKYIANGDNLGTALLYTNSGFPSEDIVGDLVIYSDMVGFDENLGRIAQDYLDNSVRRMERISAMMNSVGIIIVSLVIAWVVFGTFEMQEQITAAIS